MNAFTLVEQTIMRTLGIHDREDIRSMRKELLAEHVDWEQIGQRIMLTPAAVEKLAAALKVFPVTVAGIQTIQKRAEGVDASSSEKTRAGAFPPEGEAVKNGAAPVRLLVASHRVANPHILVCKRPGSAAGDWVYVRVKSVANFRPLPAATGEILARQVDGGPWEFAGSIKSGGNDVARCPRWPGRW